MEKKGEVRAEKERWIERGRGIEEVSTWSEEEENTEEERRMMCQCKCTILIINKSVIRSN